MEDISERCNERLEDDTQPIKISWISAHSGIQGNELVDGEAKLAARGKTSAIDALPPLLRNSLPRNASAIKQEFNEWLKTRWWTRWKNSPCHGKISRIDDQFPLTNFSKAREQLTWWQSTLILQIRTRHIPLNRYLHRIKKCENARCDNCYDERNIEVPESIQHFLFDCKTYEKERREFTRNMGRQSKDLKFIMLKPDVIEKLTRYIISTKRFE